MTYEEQIKIWCDAVEESSKWVLASKARTRKFMEGIGLDAKPPKRSAKTPRARAGSAMKGRGQLVKAPH